MIYLYYGLLAAGLLCLFFAFKQYRKTQELLMEGIKTKGTCIRLIENSDSDGTTYTPVFEFKDSTKGVRTWTAGVSSSPPAYKIGETAKLVYDPNDDDVKIISFWGLYRWVVLLLCFASPLLIISGGYLLYNR